MKNSPTHRHTLTYWSLVITVPDFHEYKYRRDKKEHTITEEIYIGFQTSAAL